MQTYQLEVNDNISEKILRLLSSFKNDVKIKRIDVDNTTKLDEVVVSIKTALKEVENSQRNKIPLNNARDLLDKL